MATVFDVAKCILQKMKGSITTMKLQKLVYYCQAWALVWDEEPMFPEHIEAWANGPVCPALYDHHKGMFRISDKDLVGDPSTLSQKNLDTIDSVIEFYGGRSSQYLSDLTHLEDPWKIARVGCTPGERCSVEITHASMAEYYQGL